MKIIDYKNIISKRNVVALGKFQGLHKGHMLLINELVRQAKKNNCESVVLSIDMPEEKKLMSDEKRAEILSDSGVDCLAKCNFSAEFAKQSSEEFVKNILSELLSACVVIVGNDFGFGYKREGNVETLRTLGKKYNYEVISFEKLKYDGKVISSSRLKGLLEEGKVEEIYPLCDRYFSLSGTVSEGKMLGRTIGFPTANFVHSEDIVTIKEGVYKTKVLIDGNLYNSVTNIGTNPTVSDDNKQTIETYIIDFSENIYGKKIEVFFEKYLRNEQKFSDIEELKQQLKKDIMNAKS